MAEGKGKQPSRQLAKGKGKQLRETAGNNSHQRNQQKEENSNDQGNKMETGRKREQQPGKEGGRGEEKEVVGGGKANFKRGKYTKTELDLCSPKHIFLQTYGICYQGSMVLFLTSYFSCRVELFITEGIFLLFQRNRIFLLVRQYDSVFFQILSHPHQVTDRKQSFQQISIHLLKVCIWEPVSICSFVP